MGQTDDVWGAQQHTQGAENEAWRIPVAGETPPQLTIEGHDEALRVLGEEGATAITLRASTAQGEALPLDLVAEIQARAGGEIRVKLRDYNEIRRELRHRRREIDPRHGDRFDDIGERLEMLTALKGLGGRLDQIRLTATVPPRCDVSLSTTNGPIQIGRFGGRVQLHSTSGPIDCARIDGNLAARTVSGPLRLGDITGSVSVQTTSGGVTTRGIAGNLVIQTTSGAAKGEALSGQLGFKSLSGALVVRESRFSGFYFNTTSGNGTIEATLAAGEYEMRTVSGGITLRPQPDLSALLSGRTVSGDFRCLLPSRHADEDWRAAIEDDERADDERDPDDDRPEITLPGLTIGKDGIDIAGVLRIDDEAIELPGMRIKIKDKRERRRGRNRWEYLLGDPARAASGQTRLRVRTVSGDLLIRPGHAATDMAGPPQGSATRPPAPRHPAAPRPEWPDAELWPEDAAMPPSPPMPPAPPEPPIVPPPARESSQTPPSAAAVAAPPSPADAPLPDVIALGPPARDAAHTETAPEEAPAARAAEHPASAPAPTPVDPATPGRDGTRLEILEALRRGEITTDEALLLLAQLDD